MPKDIDHEEEKVIKAMQLMERNPKMKMLEA